MIDGRRAVKSRCQGARFSAPQHSATSFAAALSSHSVRDVTTGEPHDRPASSGVVLDVLVEFLLGQPTALRALLSDHVDDGRGGCQRCAIGGQHGNQKWPCLIHTAAIKASALSVPYRPA
jgi:hypothetical protein